MKRLFRKACATVACLLAMGLQAQAETESLRIMTFNIPQGNIKESEGNGRNTWANRAQAICHYIDSISPDLLGIQEGQKGELIDLLAGAHGYAMVGRGRISDEWDEHTPILYKTSRFLLEASGNYWPTDTPDTPSKTPGAICYRIATWAVFTDKVTGARFIYTNTHLDHGGEEVRVPQAKVVKEKMAELAEQYGSKLPQFLTADFNTKRKSETFTYLTKYKMTTKDIWTAARKNEQKGVDGFSSTPDNQIDFIFGTGTVKCSYAELGNRWTPDGFIMSDHNPYFADVYWTTSVSDNARAAVIEARAVADSTFQWQNSRTKLITAASQLSTDGLEATSSLKDAIDRNTATYVRSRNGYPLPPNQPHYMQVDLESPVSAFNLQYNKSQDGDNGQGDRWDDVLVTASQDGERWDYVTELHGFSGEQNKTYSANIQMRRPYSHVRFLVMRTPAMRLSNGAPCYSLSEIQMYEAKPQPTCEHAASEAVARAADALYDLADHTQALAEEGTATTADVAALKEATQALRQAREDFAQPVEGVGEATDGGKAQVYTLDGMRLDVPRRGVNILHRPGKGSRRVMVR